MLFTDESYDYDPEGVTCRWRVNEAEAEVVREVFRMLLDEGMSLRGIARTLAERGVRTKTGNAVWATSMIRNVLSNEAYAGTSYYFKSYPAEPERHREHKPYRRTPKTTTRLRDRAEWIPVPVPAIVDGATLERAQARLEENKRLASRNNRTNKYLLRGLLRCASCGRTYAGVPRDGKTYYSCGGTRPANPTVGGECRASVVRADRVEPVVWDAVSSLIAQPDLLVAQYWQQRKTEVASRGDSAKRRKTLEQQLGKLDGEEMQVLRVFREGKIDDRLLDAQLGEVRAKRDQVRAELENCEAAVTEAAVAKSVEEAIRGFCDQIRDGLEEATFDEKQAILRRMIEYIEVEPDGNRGTLCGMLPLAAEDAALRPRWGGQVSGTASDHTQRRVV